MHPYFEILTPRWFKRAFVYTGSIGEFRYRFANDRENSLIHAAVYTHFCYECAKDVQERDFSWDETGVATPNDKSLGLGSFLFARRY